MTNLADIREFARDVLRETGLEDQGWDIVFNKRIRRVLGVCCYKTRNIEIGYLYAEAHGLDDNVKDTVLHEIAHALTPGHGHDKVWKRTARGLGATPTANNREKLKVQLHRWELRYGDRVVAKYMSKPRRNIKKLYLKSEPESLGKFTLHRVA